MTTSSCSAAASRIETAVSPELAEYRSAENARGRRYPLSRWWLRPLAVRLAEVVPGAIAPWHITLCGLAVAACAGATLAQQGPGWCVAAVVLAAWFFDRLDGPLARRRGVSSPAGAWLDAQVDELVDIGLHAAAALWLYRSGSANGWAACAAFVSGKYLCMHGLFQQEHLLANRGAPAGPGQSNLTFGAAAPGTRLRSWLRAAYHLPGDADVRIHLFAAAALADQLAAELWFFAAYYHCRWIVRMGLAPLRGRGAR